ncbi:MAG: DUF459 domain-containing protein [Deltaproteobacteria bacterium]|nr:DUF459 domain-containing protein [Deltaproteobacteria bacterium]
MAATRSNRDLTEATKERTNPATGLMSLWGVVLFLSLYGAPAVREDVERTPLLASTPLLPVVVALDDLAGATGISYVRNAVEAIRERVQAPFAILEQPVPEAPTPDVPVDSAPRIAGPETFEHKAPASKSRVLVIGASSIQFALGVELERQLPKRAGIKAKRLGRLASGLSRPDYFDWPRQLETLAQQFRPDLVIANYGGNCAQDIPTSRGMVPLGAPEWRAEYGARVKQMIDIAKRHGADFVYVGMPNMRDSGFAERMKLVNSVQAEVSAKEGALFVSTWEMTSEPSGKYREELTVGKKRGLMRTSDGVHFRPLGAKLIVEVITEAIERRFILGAPDAGLARVEGHAYRSPVLGAEVSYVAFVPLKASKDARVPVAVVLHEGAWGDWPTFPHSELARTAEASGFAWIALGLEASKAAPLLGSELLVDAGQHLPIDPARVVVVTGPRTRDALTASNPELPIAAQVLSSDLDALAKALAPRLVQPR